MILPIYILVTAAFPDVKSRAQYFGVVSGAGGLGAAAGPLIGGVVTSAIGWRASFGLQVLVVAWIILLARKIADPGPEESSPRFDLAGAVLSAAGLTFVVLGLLQSRTCVLIPRRPVEATTPESPGTEPAAKRSRSRGFRRRIVPTEPSRPRR